MKSASPSGSFLVFLGALLWSLNSPLVKYLTLDPLLICGLRSVIAGITLAPMIRPKRLVWNRWMVLYVSSYALLCLSIIVALTMTSSPIAIGMQYTAIIWIFLVQLVWKKQFSIRSFLPVCVIFAGVVFFMCSETSGGEGLGNLVALSEGIFFACMTVSSKKVSGTNPIGLVAVANLFTGAAVFLCAPRLVPLSMSLEPLEWGILLILGVVQIGGGYAFYNMGIQKISPQKASIVALWEMILGPLWVALFLKEYPSGMVMTGFCIILAGMVLDAKLSPAQAPSRQRLLPGHHRMSAAHR